MIRIPKHLANAARLEREVFAGRFSIESEAGVGGMGVVYRALDQVRGEVVALKIVHKTDASTLHLFEAEARALEKLQHPAIVRYITHGVDAEGEPYLAMEWVAGETLHARLRQGPLDICDAVMLGRRLADALESAHALGVVHRDIKPGNVLLPGRNVHEAKLADFGLAGTLGMGEADAARLGGVSGARPLARDATSVGTIVGTPGYTAPEQARDHRLLDGRSDLFSLGCLLFRCLSGVEAFEETSELTAFAKIVLLEPPRVSDLRADIPAALDQLVVRLLAKNPEERPGSAAIVRDELERIAENLSASRPAAPSEIRTLESAADVFFGRYVVEDRLVSAGKVFRARDTVLDRRVALKVFGGTRDRNSITQLLQKARAAAGLRHPNIATIYDAGEHAGVPFVAREYLAGEPLRGYMGEASVNLGRRVRWLCEIARALAAAHRSGVIHGEMNPDNVIVGDSPRMDGGEGGAVKVLDFGFASAGCGIVDGASAYMAPERIRGEPLDGRVDQFAWGVIAYELLTGRLPWSNDDSVALRRSAVHVDIEWPQLPVGIAEVIRKATHEERGERFPTMDALLEVLEARGMQTTQKRSDNQTGGASRGGVASASRSRRRSWLPPLLVIPIAFVVAGSIFAIFFLAQDKIAAAKLPKATLAAVATSALPAEAPRAPAEVPVAVAEKTPTVIADAGAKRKSSTRRRAPAESTEVPSVLQRTSSPPAAFDPMDDTRY